MTCILAGAGGDILGQVNNFGMPLICTVEVYQKTA
jgi:hypothetical protein